MIKTGRETVSELKEAIESLSSRNISGKDDKQPGVIKCRNSVLVEHRSTFAVSAWKNDRYLRT
ncbi:hypothetical protein DPMN_084115 [Dreissena polymorpha]|uniref:Uncharacterized protein n=1 Tax=Dreissena polymorpha TaxID=45954 RepID=A0A9D4BJ31_DREPO|nr:hypothetical protein DPMN_084115 [Dreissena polymorpha]